MHATIELIRTTKRIVLNYELSLEQVTCLVVSHGGLVVVQL